MSKPDDIPQDIWEAASAVVGPPDGLGYAKVFTVSIAAAILAERHSSSVITSGTMKNMETGELFSAVYRQWPIRKPEVIARFPDTNAGLAAARAHAAAIRRGTP